MMGDRDPTAMASNGDAIISLFESSSLYTIFPVILSTFSLLFEHHSEKLLHHVTPSLITSMQKCVSLFNEVKRKLPSKKNHAVLQMNRQETHMFESEHPYRSNTRETFTLSYPGASKITITFDEKSRTEPNCDYVKIWTDSTKSETHHPHLQKLTGRRSSAKWPGVGDVPPLEIEASGAFVEWYSDSSDEDWGWKFDAVVDFVGDVGQNQHWLLNVEDQLSHCLTVVASRLIVGTPWVGGLEDTHRGWLMDPLFEAGFAEPLSANAADIGAGAGAGGFGPREYEALVKSHAVNGRGASEEEGSEEDYSFLQNFLSRPEGSLAAIFCQYMKRFVREDQGSDELRNRAVYLTCAVIIHHNNFTTEALHLARTGAEKNQRPSVGLIDAWKCGQTLRSFLNFGQVETAEEEDLSMAPSLERGPSVYSESKDTEIVLKAVNLVVSRAQCLLRLQSSGAGDVLAVLNAPEPSLISVGRTDISSTDRLGKFISTFENAFTPNMLPAYSKLQDSSRKESAGLSGASSRKKGRTITGGIIRFLKGKSSIQELNKVCSLRSERANIRALGLTLLSTLILSESLSWVQFVTSSFLDSCTAEDSSNVNYLNAIEGCNREGKQNAMTAFSAYLRNLLRAIMNALSRRQDPATTALERQENVAIILCCLKGLCFDFSLLDCTLLQEAGVLSCLQATLLCGESEVRSTTVSVVEFIMARCLFVENHERILHPARECTPSTFQKHLFALIIGVLDAAAGQDVLNVTPSASQVATGITRAGGTLIVPGSVMLGKEMLGYRAPHVPIGLQHSIAFWIRRPRRPFDGLLEEVVDSVHQNMLSEKGSDNWAQIGRKLCGMVVIHGPHWSETKEGGEGTSSKTPHSPFGIIQDFNSKTCMATVQWEHGKDAKKNSKSKNTYLFGAFVEGILKFQVTLADKVVMGHIYSKGMNVCRQKSAKGQHWKVFGLQMKADGKLQTCISNTADSNYYLQSANSLPPDEWTHVCVVQDQVKTLLYVNGRLDSETVIDDSMLYAETQTQTKSSGSDVDGSDAKSLLCELNEMPMYIGQTPFYIDNMEGLCSFEGSIQDLCVYGSKALPLEEIKELSKVSYRDSVSVVDEVFCLQAVGLIHKESIAFRDFTSVLLQDQFISERLLGPLCRMLAEGSATTKCGVLRLCARLLPSFSPTLVDKAAMQAGLLSPTAAAPSSFLEFAFQQLGQLTNSYAEYKKDKDHQQEQADPCSEVEAAVGLEYGQLLTALAVAPLWCEPLGVVLETLLSSGLSLRAAQDICSVQNEERFCSALAVLAFCGGEVTGLCVGSTARYQLSTSGVTDTKEINKDKSGAGGGGGGGGMMEDCVILAPTWPPSEDALALKWKGRETDMEAKIELARWENKSSFADAFYIALTSQPLTAILVPRDSLFTTTRTHSRRMESFFKNHLSSLVKFFHGVIGLSVSDSEHERSAQTAHLKLMGMQAFHALLKSFPWLAMESAPVLRSLVDVTLQQIPNRPIPPSPPLVKPIVMESKHDYDHNANDYFPIKIPGAKSLRIEFDPETRSERNYDYMRFYKDETHTEYFGEDKYTGGRGNWPGTGSNDALIIPADSCVIFWRTDSSGNDWGWKLTITVESYKVPQQVGDKGCYMYETVHYQLSASYFVLIVYSNMAVIINCIIDSFHVFVFCRVMLVSWTLRSACTTCVICTWPSVISGCALP